MGTKILWVFATLFLFFIYPFVLVANIISFATPAEAVVQTSQAHQIIFKSFLWISLCYPLTYGMAWLFKKRVSKRGREALGHYLAFLPLAHAFLIWILFFLSFATENMSRKPVAVLAHGVTIILG